MTTSAEGKKLKNAEPHWQPDGLLNIASERYAKRKETLADVLLLAERLSADNPSDAAAVERLIELVEHGRRLAVSLLTACKATQTQQAKNSRVPPRGRTCFMQRNASRRLPNAPATGAASSRRISRAGPRVSGSNSRRPPRAA